MGLTVRDETARLTQIRVVFGASRLVWGVQPHLELGRGMPVTLVDNNAKMFEATGSSRSWLDVETPGHDFGFRVVEKFLPFMVLREECGMVAWSYVKAEPVLEFAIASEGTGSPRTAGQNSILDMNWPQVRDAGMLKTGEMQFANNLPALKGPIVPCVPAECVVRLVAQGVQARLLSTPVWTGTRQEMEHAVADSRI